MSDPALDRDDPVPLYRQIASHLRYAIATGRLAPGTRLPSLRSAADRWDVNLHTVRRGYGILEEAGLIRTSVPAGSVVAGDAEAAATEDVRAWVEEVVEEAAARFGMTRSGLIGLLDEGPPTREGRREPRGRTVSVLECSHTLAARLASQVSEIRGRTVQASRIGSGGEPAPGPVVSTYFHHGELRRALAGRAEDLLFVTIRPAEAFLAEIERRCAGGRAILLETDELLAHNLKLELTAAAGGDLELEVRIPPDPAAAIAGIREDVPILVSPRNWDAVSAAGVRDDRLLEVRYEIEEGDRERLRKRLWETG